MLELEKPELSGKRILRRLPAGKGFTFFNELDQSTEMTVHSLEEFYSALEAVGLKSVRFHIKRGDFEGWLRHVVGDEKLADEIVHMSNKSLSSRELRKRFLGTVEARITELKEMPVKS